MRILLIQAVSTHDCGELVFPLGLARLAAAIEECHEVRGLDLNLNPFPWPDLLKILDEFKPQAVGISFRNLDPLAGNLTSFVPQLKTLAALIRQHASRARVILGGSAFTLFSRRLMEEVPEVDIGVVGEAEAVFPMLLEHFDNVGTVPGIIWRDEHGEVQTNRSSQIPVALDRQPFPRWRLFDPAHYQTQNRYVAFMGVETKRGCAHRCRYCLYPNLQGRHVRLRSPRAVVDELQALREEYNVELVHFTDPVVNQPPAHLQAICEEILRRRLPIKWTGFFREDSLAASDVELYCRAGLAAFYFSADAASDHALKILGKELSREQILGAARLAADSSIITVYHFLVNLPGEDEQSIAQTRELLDALFSIHASSGNIGAVVFNNLRLYPGAPLTEDILENGLIDSRADLLYPTYFNPPPRDHLRHELTAYCMQRIVADHLNLHSEISS